MDARFARLYQDELAHLKESGREFAREHPKIAARLSMDGVEVADPYVERLLEGFAFLAARVRLKLDAEHPRLIAQLLESMYPNFLAPVPSMLIARFDVDTADPNLTQGHVVARGSAMHSTQPRGQDTLCEFRTAMAVTLWPIELVQVQYFSHAPDLGLAHWPAARAARGGLRIRLRAGAGLRFDQIGIDRLTLHIAAADDVAFRLHELVLGASLGSLVGHAGAGPIGARWRDASSVRPVGLADDEALLPESLRRFSGHRLLQEAAALPQRLLFFEIADLAPRLAGVAQQEVELVLPFDRADPALEALVDTASLALYCTPAINLFPKRLDRIVLGPDQWDYHAVADRTRPMDYEVHSIERVQGHGLQSEGVLDFHPLYRWRHDPLPGGQGFYTLRREPRRPSERQRQQGGRVPSYLGEEVFLTLVDPGHGPYREALRQLSIQAWVTNRDLPMLLPPGGGRWSMEAPGPVSAVHCLRGPTRPVSRQPQGEIGWQLISQLTREHLSLDDDGAANAASLREMLQLHGPPGDVAWARQAEGIVALRVRPVVRRLPFDGPLCFGSGLAIVLVVDEQAFQGASAFLLAGVIEACLTRHAAINSFAQLTLESLQRGTVIAWPPRVGARPVL